MACPETSRRVSRRIHVIVAIVNLTLVPASLGSAAWAADKPVTVWLESPSRIQDQLWIKQNAERMRSRSSLARRLWDANRGRLIKYTVTLHTDFVQLACDAVPVEITLVNGHPIKLTPVTSVGGCKAKELYGKRSGEYESLILTPDEMFGEIDRSIASTNNSSPSCVQAEFDTQTGIPVSLQGGCPGTSDDGWRLTVTNLQVGATSTDDRALRKP